MSATDLEHWSYQAAQALQDFCDIAQIVEGDPKGESELQDIRELLKEHAAIVSGEGFLINQLKDGAAAPIALPETLG